MSRKRAVWLFLGIALVAVGLAGRAQAGNEQLVLTVVDEKTQQPIACRMHLAGPNNQRPRKADHAAYWFDHFVFPGQITLKLPLGNYNFELEREPEYHYRDGHFSIERSTDNSKQVDMRRAVDMAKEGWWSGDLLVRRPPRDAQLLMDADDLRLGQSAHLVERDREQLEAARHAAEEPADHVRQGPLLNVLAGG